MSELHDDSYLLEILDSAEQIKKFTENKSIEDFEKDLMCPLAIQRLFEIMVKLLKVCHKSCVKSNSHIDWKAMAGMRDVLIHQYQNANNDRILKIAKNIIPLLILEIKKIIAN